MTKITLVLCTILVSFCEPAHAVGDEPAYLYKVSLVQAAPGKLPELIDLYKIAFADLQKAGDEAPLWMRHSQGDRWDLMILYPMNSYAEYYKAERIAKRDKIDLRVALMPQLIAWQEDLFAAGPPIAELQKAFATGGFFHVEMFISLPGKFGDLYKERQMENAYSKALKEPENFIFVRDQGAAWDIFTIGVFRDLKHYAESADVPAKDQEAAAKAAGFEAPSQIGPYLRRFIREHHDTLAVAVK